MPAETITWVAPDGTTIPFDGSVGYTVSDGVTGTAAGGPDGRFAPTFNLVTETLPNDGGTRLRNVAPQPRTITVPLSIDGPDASTTRARWRALVTACDPQRGDGRLQFTDPDGNQREFLCRYTTGLEGEDSIDKSAPNLTSWLVAPQFVAFSPFSQDTVDTQNTWSTADGGGSFFPIFPIKLGSSTVFAETTITVPGDQLAWPVWQINGPASQVTLVNETLNRQLSWGGTIGKGETLTIDTRPGSMSTDPKSVRDQRGINRFAELTAWDIWPFSPGSQHVLIEMSGATSDSLVIANYRARYSST